MGHSISGIVTSFKYEAELPNIVLVGNYHLIPLSRRFDQNYTETAINPYDEFSKSIRNILKDLSFYGKCAYIETEFFGGLGTQFSETWENGKRIEGPLMSHNENLELEIHPSVTIVESAINQTLKSIGIYKHEGKDEFDSIGLGKYRSNSDILEIIKK